MPRSKTTNGSKNTLPVFVSCTLSDADKATCEAHLLDDAGIVDFLVKMVEKDIKVSLGYDSWNDAVLCTLTQKSQKDGGAGSALSSRGPGVYEAVTVSAFKFFEKLAEDLQGAPQETQKRSWS